MNSAIPRRAVLRGEGDAHTVVRARTAVAVRMATATCMIIITVLLAACGADTRTPASTGTSLDISELLGGADTLHARAVEPREFVFPQDHGPHPAFRTEWWYFTGNLTADDGTLLGYQLTFFRSALVDSSSFVAATGSGRSAHDDSPSPDAATRSGRSAHDDSPSTSAWRSRHAYMAHFAVTDASAGRFDAAELFSRGAAGLAGAETDGRRVWLHDWSAVSLSESTFPMRLRASSGDIAIDLVVEQGKPIVLQGDRGLSPKGPEPGNASYYYSLTRMPTRGTVRFGDDEWTINGTSWLDREWSTSVLSPGITGWDWLSLQFADSTELMMYRLRRSDGSPDAFSAATFVAPDGSTRAFGAADFTMMPTETWRAADGVAYPVAWRIEIPALELTLDVTTPVNDQELDLAVRYWEGMVRADGTRGGRPVLGRGYLEMTGYTGSPVLTR